MIYTVPLPRIGTDLAWRDAAKRLVGAGVSPQDVLWDFDNDMPALFEGTTELPPPTRRIKAPASFVELADTVVWHKDPQRFARLYTVLWRLRHAPGLMQDVADPDLARLRQMEKAVRRCQHKMKAFVRFRDLRQGGDRRSFAAWFEPTHHTMEPTAPFFARRFADMDWMIATPDVTAQFIDGNLTFHPGQPKPDLPDDAAEALWGTYFCNIFNPARVKVHAMTSEMPRKYWKNLPEAQHIPDLIAGAEAKVAAMRAAAPTLPPERMERIRTQLAEVAQPASWNILEAGVSACTRCPLHCHATQSVPGCGPRDAALMVVAEQPGDIEDQTGTPLVGPAGTLFRDIALRAGLDPDQAYLTNAVKHFKFTQRGKKRIHQNPSTAEVEHCLPWLRSEVQLLKPRLILAMGATAARATTGDGRNIMKRRGTIETGADGISVYLTIHPSALLRMPPAERPMAEAAYAQDLAACAKLLRENIAPKSP